jgi:hypothetical protein
MSIMPVRSTIGKVAETADLGSADGSNKFSEAIKFSDNPSLDRDSVGSN